MCRRKTKVAPTLTPTYTFWGNLTLKPAAESFKQGWYEAQMKEIKPLKKLWNEIENDQL